MIEPPEEPDLSEATATRRSRWQLQLVWLVPLFAVLIGGWLAVQAILEKGPTITISFSTGDGLEAGKTKIKFRNVDMGVVKSITLAPDQKSVIVTAELTKHATNMLVDNTRFWVVRPRISGGTVSGLGTLLSGSFIGMDIGSKTKPRSDFIGLETPPVFASDVPGREFILKSETIGSLDVGAPVFFRRLQVGQITAYNLDADGKSVTLRIFVNAPYDKYVRSDTRFWQASGVDVSLDTSGIKVNTQSLVAVLIGGLAFESPPDSDVFTGAANRSEFRLFNDRTEAMKQHDRIVDTYVFNFKESVRGLAVGAPIDFRGIVVGEVTAIHTHFNPVTKEFSIPVEAHIYPERFTLRFEGAKARGGRVVQDRRALSQWLVERGFRAQLRTGNLLTGQLYIAMDFFPNAPKASMNWDKSPPEMPTAPGGLQSLQDSVTTLMAKLNRIPFDGIGKDLRTTLQSAGTLLNTLDDSIVPDARATLLAARTALDSANRTLQPDSPLAQNTVETMRELSRTAASLRVLADYLERHPEALIRGKLEENR